MTDERQVESSDRGAYRLGLFDVRDALSAHRANELIALARRGNAVDEPGMDLGAVPSAQRPLRYRVTDGSVVRAGLPWLWKLYEGLFRDLASSIYGGALDLARDLKSAVNMNYMAGPRDSYEWHRDTNAVTGLLFVTTHELGGGALVFDNEDIGLRASLTPRSGWFAAFDARRTLHTIEPLLSDHDERVTVPMNYYAPGDPQIRDGGLNEHVYGRPT